MMNGIKRYFGSLPVSFGNALLASITAAFLTGLQTYLLLTAKSKPIDLNAVYIFPILNYGVWLLISPMLFRAMLRVIGYPLSVFHRNVAIVTLGVGFTLWHEVLALVIYNMGAYALYSFEYLERFAINIHSGILGLSKTFVEYWVIYFLLYHFHAKKEFRHAQLRNIQLESNLVKAQMSALKNQLHPHFLFNSFNTISALMEEDIPLAQRMIAKLGLLLRKILKEGDLQFVSLEDEVEMAKLYLEVEQIRFKGRLITRFSIDPAVKMIPVPTLILQPAVENAIKHGFYNKVGSCEISIKAFEEGDYIHIAISDNGEGKRNDALVSFGLGLTNMENRLKTSYGEEYELRVNSKSATSGFIVEIKVRKEATQNENIYSINR